VSDSCHSGAWVSALRAAASGRGRTPLSARLRAAARTVAVQASCQTDQVTMETGLIVGRRGSSFLRMWRGLPQHGRTVRKRGRTGRGRGRTWGEGRDRGGDEDAIVGEGEGEWGHGHNHREASSRSESPSAGYKRMIYPPSRDQIPCAWAGWLGPEEEEGRGGCFGGEADGVCSNNGGGELAVLRVAVGGREGWLGSKRSTHVDAVGGESSAATSASASASASTPAPASTSAEAEGTGLSLFFEAAFLKDISRQTDSMVAVVGESDGRERSTVSKLTDVATVFQPPVSPPVSRL
jgi:hypothetical protein